MDPIQVLATVAVFALVVKGVVDAVRRQFAGLDGLTVQIIAIVLGAGAAAAFDLRATAALLETAGATAVGRVPPPFVDYIITGGAMAFTAGFFAEVSGKSGDDETGHEIVIADPS